MSSGLDKPYFAEEAFVKAIADKLAGEDVNVDNLGKPTSKMENYLKAIARHTKPIPDPPDWTDAEDDSVLTKITESPEIQSSAPPVIDEAVTDVYLNKTALLALDPDDIEWDDIESPYKVVFDNQNEEQCFMTIDQVDSPEVMQVDVESDAFPFYLDGHEDRIVSFIIINKSGSTISDYAGTGQEAPVGISLEYYDADSVDEPERVYHIITLDDAIIHLKSASENPYVVKYVCSDIDAFEKIVSVNENFVISEGGPKIKWKKPTALPPVDPGHTVTITGIGDFSHDHAIVCADGTFINSISEGTYENVKYVLARDAAGSQILYADNVLVIDSLGYLSGVSLGAKLIVPIDTATITFGSESTD